MNRKRIALYIAIGVLPILIGAALAGWDVWYQSTYFVRSDEAQITGPIVPVVAPASGRINELLVEVGDSVAEGDIVARLAVPPAAAAAAPGGATVPVARNQVNIRAPFSGAVVARPVTEGSAVTSGQTVLALVDLQNLWVVASVDERKVTQIRPGQPVEVYVKALDRTLQGEVVQVVPAAGTITTPGGAAPGTQAAAAAQRTAGAPRLPQTVPVKIALQYRDEPLFPGMSVDAKIAVRR